MPVFSSISIEFLVDFDLDYGATITTSTPLGDWSWVASRSAGFEVTVGTPTATTGERTALNFKTAFDLDFPTGYVTTVVNNIITIASETENEDFIGFKATDENDVILGASGYSVTFGNYTPPFDITTVTTALVRSPHYIYTPFFFSTTTAVTIELKIWSGDIVTDEPITPTQVLTITRPTVDFAEFNTNIADTISNYLESYPLLTTGLDFTVIEANNNESVWCKYVASYIDQVEEITTIEGTLGASDGYGEFMDGANPTFDGVLTSVNTRKVAKGSVITLPFLNNDKYNNLTITAFPSGTSETYTLSYAGITGDAALSLEGGGVVLLEDVLSPLLLEQGGGGSTITNVFVAYAQSDLSELPTTDTRVVFTFSGTGIPDEIFTYNIIEECRYTPKTIVFKNKHGFYDTLTMFAKNTEDLNVTSQTFVNNYVTNGTYETYKHQYKDINVIGKQSIVCNSGHVKEIETALYEQLLMSEYAWIYENEQLIPVKLNTKQFTYKTRINDGLIEYQIKFDYAFNLLNNI